METLGNPLQLKSLNHISIVCKSLNKSLNFYQNVLGFFPIRRPESFGFNGAWLFNYGIGIHLLQCENPENLPHIITHINPKDNHISFQCESMAIVEKKLTEMEVHYVKARVSDGGVHVDQIFFHDPDGFMIEICNCDNLPVIPLTTPDNSLTRSCSRITCNINSLVSQVKQQQQQQQQKSVKISNSLSDSDLDSLSGLICGVSM